MNANEAYRKGQEDMRRRCEKLWENYVVGEMATHIKPPLQNRSRVGVWIRHRLKVKDLAVQEELKA